jgi:hypothetical protein
MHSRPQFNEKTTGTNKEQQVSEQIKKHEHPKVNEKPVALPNNLEAPF